MTDLFYENVIIIIIYIDHKYRHPDMSAHWKIIFFIFI